MDDACGFFSPRIGAIQPQRSLAQHSSPRQYLDRSADAVLEHTPWNDSNYVDFNHNMSMPEDPVDAYLRKGAPRKPPRSYADLSPTHWRKLTKLEQENRISKSMGDLRVEEVTAEAVPSSGYPSRGWLLCVLGQGSLFGDGLFCLQPISSSSFYFTTYSYFF